MRSQHALAEKIYEALKVDEQIGLTGICRAINLKATTGNRTKVSGAMSRVAVIVTERMPGYKLSRIYPPAVGGLYLFRIDQDDTVAARKWPIAKMRQSLSIQRNAVLSLAPTGISGLMAKLLDAQAHSTAMALEVLIELDTGQ